MLISIQYIRALAAIMVVIVHTFGGFGAQGVDIFFVISGFIMMHIMSSNHRGALEFFWARFLRVAPIYYIFTAIAIFVGNANEPTLEHLIHSLLFLKIKWSSPVLSIGWTLEYEFVFYCLCALSLTLPFRKFRPFFITVLLVFLSVLLDFILFPEKAYGHFLEFIMGMLCFYIITKVRSCEIKLNKYVLLCISVSCLISLYLVQELVYPNDKLPYRFVGYGILSFIFCLSFILIEEYLPKSNMLLLLGNASYSIYITHTTTLFLYYKTFNVNRYDSFLSDSFSIILVLIIGILSHIYIEKIIARKVSAKRMADKMLSNFPLSYMPNKWLQRTK